VAPNFFLAPARPSYFLDSPGPNPIYREASGGAEWTRGRADGGKEERELAREPAQSKLARLAATRGFFFLAISAE
jgi:hypothetical protein